MSKVTPPQILDSHVANKMCTNLRVYSRGVNRAGPRLFKAGLGPTFRRAGPGRKLSGPGRSFANLARIRADPGRNKSIKCVAKEGTKVEI